MSEVERGWQPDPIGRHEFRWWDGTAWSDIVADNGVETVDRLDAFQPAAPAVGLHPQPEPRPSGSNRVALGAAIAVVVAVVVVGIVAVAANRDGGSDEPDAPRAADPREALISAGDMPAEWQESDVIPTAPSEDLMCEPRLEPADPGRKTEVSFDRGEPPGSLTHQIGEFSPEVAGDLLDEAERQAGQCGTYNDVDEVAGETWRATTTPELLTGPTFGDETLWYVLHVDNEVPEQSKHDVLICLDRHGGVLSAFTLSTPPPTSDVDRTLVEDLARTVSDRLES